MLVRNQQLTYNEVAQNAQDLGASPLEKFDSSPEQRRHQTRNKSKSIPFLSNTFNKSNENVKGKASLAKKSKSSNATGFHTGTVSKKYK